MAFPEMTIAIASYQRREPLLRLLTELDRQGSSFPDLAAGLEVTVVLDGSDDGSLEAVWRGSWSIPVQAIWQPNRGLAAARNVGLESASGRLVWFLDDDLVPADGLVRRHRSAHDSGEPAFLVGPCRLPPDSGAPEPLVRWWDDFYADLAGAGAIERFDRFTTANASVPAHVVEAVGGFDETFTTYGLEDYELAVRLLAAGVTLRFDAEAVAWHPDVPPKTVLVGRERSLGYNAAQLARLHPDTVESVFPLGTVAPPRRLLRRLRIRRPAALMAVSRAAFLVHRAAGARWPITANRAEKLSRAAAHASGVAAGDTDGTLLPRVLGYPEGGGRRPWVRRGSSAADSRQPPTSPTSNETTISR